MLQISVIIVHEIQSIIPPEWVIFQENIFKPEMSMKVWIQSKSIKIDQTINAIKSDIW